MENGTLKKENYIEQLKYVNKVTLETIREILKNSNSIIIIHSDHGIHGVDHGIKNYSDDITVNDDGNISEEVFQERFNNDIYT